MHVTRSCTNTSDWHLKRKLRVKNVNDRKDARLSSAPKIANLALES